MYSNRSLGCVPLFLTSILLFVPLLDGQSASGSPKTGPSRSHTRPAVPQEVFAPFWTIQPGWHTELMIRNNTSKQMSVTPVLRTKDGTEINLGAVSIPTNDSRSVSVGKALARAASSISSDSNAYGSVVFRYTAVSTGYIYASVMVGPVGSPVMFHFDASRSFPTFPSGSYQSIWWKPSQDDTDTLVLANLSERKIAGNIRLLDAKGRGVAHPFDLGPRQSQQVTLTELLNKDGFDGKFGGLSIEPQSDGGYLQVLQYTVNQSTGMGALLKVFPKAVSGAKQSTIRAAMIAMAHPDSALALPDDTRLNPEVFLYNSTSRAIAAHVTVDWHSDAEWGRKPIPDLTIAPGATQVVSLNEADEQRLGIPVTANWGSAEVSYASDDGDLVAMTASLSTDGKYLVQTPFTDALSFHWKGGAWMADPDHNALITAGNAGTKPAKLDFKLWFGSATPYELPIRTLQPGEAITVNVGQIISTGQPDRKGLAIPPTVTSGTYDFSDLADSAVGYLYEGKQQIDKTYGHATYGCAFCCYYDDGWITDFSGNVGDTGTIYPMGEQDCQDNFSDNIIPATSVSGWASSDTNVATVSPGMAHAVGPGQAVSLATAYVRTHGAGDYWKSCPFAHIDLEGSLSVNPPVITGPNTVWWFNGQNPTGYATSVTLQSSAGSGTTWSVTGNSAAVNISPTSVVS